MNTPSINTLRTTICAALLAAVSLAPAAHAQNLRNGEMVNVPFAFETGYQHFPAGVYIIRMESSYVLSLHGASVSGLVMAQVDGDPQPATTDKIVFRKTGGKVFLGEIWVAEQNGYLDVPKSKAESKAQVAVAGIPAAQTRVELSLLQASH